MGQTPVVYDPAAQFSATNNPAGAWSYGYENTLGGQFFFYTQPVSLSGLEEWRTNMAAGPPVIEYNPATNAVNLGTPVIPGGGLAFHPGAGDQYSTLRFTAPAPGQYQVTGAFFGEDLDGTTTDVHLLTNGASVLDGEVTGFGSGTGPVFNQALNLQAGEFLDFAVGFGNNGTYFYDTTGLSLQVVYAGVAAQAAPLVSITNPVPGAVFKFGGFIQIAEGVANGIGIVTNVAIYAGTSLLASLTNSPYSLLWTNAPPGTNTLVAIATSSSGLSTTSSPVNILVDTPPFITLQPAGVTTNQAADVSFVVAPTGSSPLACQWLFNGVPLPGATNTTLLLAGIQESNLGGYSAVLSNPVGSVTSSVASLSFVLGGRLAYVADQSGNLGLIDLDTGAYSLIGNSGSTLSGLGETPDGALYAGVLGGRAFVSISKVNGSLTQIGLSSITFSGFGSAGGVLYAVDNALNLYSIDPATGAATLIGPTGLANLGRCGMSTGGDLLYMTALDTNGPSPYPISLYWIKPSTGGATLIGATDEGGGVLAMLFEGGSLYAGVDAPQSLALLNTATGGGSFVARASLAGSGFSGLAPVTNAPPASEPLVSIVAPLNQAAFALGVPIEFLAAGSDAFGTITNVELFDFATNLLAASGALPFSAQITNLGVGAHSLTAIAADTLGGSGVSAAVKIQVVAAPVIVQQPSSVEMTNGGSASFSGVAMGAGPLTYQWRFNGTNLPANIIVKVAGNGTAGFSGDGGPATNAGLRSPTVVAVDPSGNIFIADELNFRIRKVGANGIISTVAGNGAAGAAGDGGQATNATMVTPHGVTVDSYGNIFVADVGAHNIRMVGSDGIIHTVAGGGTNNPGYGGPATNASLNSPFSVAVDAAGNLFIADTGTYGTASATPAVFKVATNGFITAVAGSGKQGYSGDGGPATNASLNYPHAVVLDSLGNLFIADENNRVVREVGTNGVISTVAGNGAGFYSGDGGPATNASIGSPLGLALDRSGNLYIADQYNFVIRRVDPNGMISRVAGNGLTAYSGDGGPAINAGLVVPDGLAVDASGNLFIADFSNNRVRKVFFNQTTNLTLANVSVTTAGQYQVIVTSPYGSVTSAVATLAIVSSLPTNVPPAITQQPQSQTVTNGVTVSFIAVAAGTAPLNYQWFFDGARLPGQTGPSLTIPSVTTNQVGGYSVIVTNLAGAVTSSIARLSVIVPVGPISVAITSPSNGAIQIAGASILVSAAAAEPGGSITRIDLYDNNSTLLGSTNAALFSGVWTHIPAGTNLLTAVATDAAGLSATSAPVIVSVTNPVAPVSLAVTISSPAANATVCNGNDIIIDVQVTNVQTVAFVRFYAGDALLGSVDGQPGATAYSLDWLQSSTIPLTIGDYVLSAVAMDTLGNSATSAPVAVAVLAQCAQVAIVRAAPAPEIDALRSYLARMGLSSQIFDQAGLAAAALSAFELIIWDDAGLSSNAPSANTVDALSQSYSNGIPLYLIGQRLASSAALLPPAQGSEWRNLTFLSPTSGTTGAETVLVTNLSALYNPILAASFGGVTNFNYPAGLDLATNTQPLAEVFGVAAGADVLIAYPGPDLPPADFSGTNIFVQNVLVLPAGAPESNANLEILFQNAVCWLTTCSDCQALQFDLGYSSAPATVQAGQAFTVALNIQNNSECASTGVLVTNVLPPGARFVGASSLLGTSVYDPAANQVVFYIGLLPRSLQVELDVTMVADVPGIVTNTASGRQNSSAPSPAPAAAVITVQPNAAPLLDMQFSTSKALQLRLTGQPGIQYEVDNSIDLVHWLFYTNVAGPGWNQILPPATATNSRLFFRAVAAP